MMATYNNNAHPLPSAPVGGASMQPPQQQQPYHQQQQQQQQQARQYPQQQPQHQQPLNTMAKDRRARGMSFRSDKSHQSGNSHKLDPETHEEKEAKRLHTKADPSMAIVEAEPSAVAATAKTSLAPLRSIVHRDSYGNPIADPDRSNPTRSRWERPLDTIRSFEAAIDGGYSRKSSIPDIDNNNSSGSNNFSRRNSYFSVQGANPPAATGSNSGNGYYRGQQQQQQQQQIPSSNSAYDLRQNLHGRDSYYDYQGAAPQAPGQSRQRNSRMPSEPQIQGHLNANQNQQNVYPGGNYNHRSYETVASGSGSNGEPAGYQTDPTSSDNSSIERRQSPGKTGAPGAPGQFNRRPSPMNDLNGGYGYNNNNMNANNSYSGYNAPKPQIQLNGGGAGADQDGLMMTAASNNVTRKQTNPGAGASLAPSASAGDDKRKSWLSRKFSKKN